MADKQQVLDCISDAVANLLYYDRKEDEDMPRGEIERLIDEGEISIEEIVAHFTNELVSGLIEE